MGKSILNNIKSSPWSWVTTLNFAEGIPNAIVVTMSVLMYKNLGVSNTKTALFTSLIYLAWVIKPLWSPIVDIVATKRKWILWMELAMGVAFGATAFLLLTPWFFVPTLILLGLVAFMSATHDIAADGFYMLGLSEHQQSYFVGVRSLCYRLAMVAITGGSPLISGLLIKMGISVALSWAIVFGIVAALFIALSGYHTVVLPRPSTDCGKPDHSLKQIALEFGKSFDTFFAKPGIGVAMLFMVFYRLPESLLVKMITPFLVDPVEKGGLGLTNEDVGVAYGLIGVIGLLTGGLLGGWLISRNGLRRWFMPMAVAMSLSCLAFVVLCHVESPSWILINAMVFVEQFGYGFGFAAYMMYLIYFARGNFATSHYAICTGFMALGLMVPGMFAGLIQESVGYVDFFWLTIVCCVVTIGVTMLVRGGVDADFGRKRK